MDAGGSLGAGCVWGFRAWCLSVCGSGFRVWGSSRVEGLPVAEKTSLFRVPYYGFAIYIYTYIYKYKWIELCKEVGLFGPQVGFRGFEM